LLTTRTQAFGAGNAELLAVLFQRTVLFLWVHCIPLSIGLLAIPQALGRANCDPELVGMVQVSLSVWSS
jgi:MATE family multidrug resistance protein